MNHSLTILFIFLLFPVMSLSPVLSSAEDKTENDVSYLCAADKSVGFSFHKITGEWKRAFFRAEDKYIISKSKKKGFTWEVKRVGNQMALTFCEEAYGYLFCKGIYNFYFNKNNLRFLMTYSYGYWNNTQEEGDEVPQMEIGKCDPL
jgi:hypothetical protein